MEHTPTGVCHNCVKEFPIDEIEVCKKCHSFLICQECSEEHSESCKSEE